MTSERPVPELKTTRKPSTWMWFTVHVFYPMLPFLLEGAIRLVANSFVVKFDTFSSSSLSMSLGLLAIFINQSLINYEPPLAGDEERDSLRFAASVFLYIAMVSFCLFAILVLLRTIGEQSPSPVIQKLTHAFEVVVFLGWIIPIAAAVAAQRSFKLRTTL